MTLAIAKEMLGYVRGKYSTVPIPNAEMTLNQADLIAAATAEKTALLERKSVEQDALIKELDAVPRVIYIG